MSDLITTVAYPAVVPREVGSDGVLQRLQRQRTQPRCGAAAKGHRRGEFPAPTQCELCLATSGRLNYHNEDYSEPFDVHPICWGCHSALHIRFTKPERWEKRKQIIRAQRQIAGNSIENRWWEQLTLEPIDINPKHRDHS